MKPLSPLIRWPLTILAIGLIAYGLFQMTRTAVTGRIYAWAALAVLLAAWIIGYRVIHRFYFKTLPKDYPRDQNSK